MKLTLKYSNENIQATKNCTLVLYRSGSNVTRSRGCRSDTRVGSRMNETFTGMKTCPEDKKVLRGNVG